VLPAPTFLCTQIQQFKNKKRGQRRAWGEEISAEIRVFLQPQRGAKGLRAFAQSRLSVGLAK
jgi:hypothetical protein